MRGVRSRLSRIATLSVVIFAVLYGLLAPPFFGFDTYHYLELSLRPTAGDNHPIGFGYILFVLALLARFTHCERLDVLFLSYQSVCLAASVVLLTSRRGTARSVVEGAVGRMPGGMVVVLTPFVLLGMLFVANAFVSEVTSIFEIIAISMLIRSLVRRWSWAVAAATVLMMLVAYHTRYMMIVAPLALIIVSVRINRGSWLDVRLGIVALTSLLAIVLADLLFAKIAMWHSDLKRIEGSRGVQISMLCTLRCDADVFLRQCDTPGNRQAIEAPRCTEFFHRLKPTGTPRVAYESGVTTFLLQANASRVAKWLLLAPLVYLEDIHQLELGPVDFGSMTNAIAQFPEAVEYYDRDFTYSRDAAYSPTFGALIGILDRLYFLRVYHLLTGIVVAISCWSVMRIADPASRFLAAYAIGTYLLFAYLNPSAPFRYLLQVLTPGYCSLLLLFVGRSSDRADPSS